MEVHVNNMPIREQHHQFQFQVKLTSEAAMFTDLLFASVALCAMSSLSLGCSCGNSFRGATTSQRRLIWATFEL